jgi:hypothetical protein
MALALAAAPARAQFTLGTSVWAPRRARSSVRRRRAIASGAFVAVITTRARSTGTPRGSPRCSARKSRSASTAGRHPDHLAYVLPVKKLGGSLAFSSESLDRDRRDHRVPAVRHRPRVLLHDFGGGRRVRAPLDRQAARRLRRGISARGSGSGRRRPTTARSSSTSARSTTSATAACASPCRSRTSARAQAERRLHVPHRRLGAHLR